MVYDVYEGNELVDKVCGFDTSLCIDYNIPSPFNYSEPHLGYDIALLQTENNTIQSSSEIVEYLDTFKSLMQSDLYYGDNPFDEYDAYYSTYTDGDYTSHDVDAHLYLYRDDILDYDYFDIINYDFGSWYYRIDILFQQLDLVIEENPTIQEETTYSVDEISMYHREEDRVVDLSLYVEDNFLYVYIEYLEVDFLNNEYTETSTYRLYIDDSGTMLVDFITIEQEYGYDELEYSINLFDDSGITVRYNVSDEYESYSYSEVSYNPLISKTTLYGNKNGVEKVYYSELNEELQYAMYYVDDGEYTIKHIDLYDEGIFEVGQRQMWYKATSDYNKLNNTFVWNASDFNDWEYLYNYAMYKNGDEIEDYYLRMNRWFVGSRLFIEFWMMFDYNPGETDFLHPGELYTYDGMTYQEFLTRKASILNPIMENNALTDYGTLIDGISYHSRCGYKSLITPYIPYEYQDELGSIFILSSGYYTTE